MVRNGAGLEEQVNVADLLLAKARQHATLVEADERAIRAIPSRKKVLTVGADVVRQGDKPDSAIFVLRGVLARYHTLAGGDRQYLSFHIRGDLPDIQSMFLSIMDHSVSAVNEAEIAALSHQHLCNLFLHRPTVMIALWRLTLIDAAIFRQSITNNSARSHLARLAHFFCEQFYRAREAGLAEGASCALPLNQLQLGQTLAMSQVSVNRAMQKLRRAQAADLRFGRLEVRNWPSLTGIAGFDPTYLHLDAP